MAQCRRRLLATPRGMVEMFTTPREGEAKIVKEILRGEGIRYKSREECREYGHRRCIYVPARDSDRAYKAIDEGLSERGM